MSHRVDYASLDAPGIVMLRLAPPGDERRRPPETHGDLGASEGMTGCVHARSVSSGRFGLDFRFEDTTRALTYISSPLS